MNTGFILGIIAYVGWGSGDIFTAYASRKIGTRKTAVLGYVFSFLIASLYIPIAFYELKNITIGLFILNIILGFLFMFANYMIIKAFELSSASIVGILVQGFPAVVLLLSALIFKDPISAKQVLWVLLIFTGAFLCTANFNDFKKGKFAIDLGIKYALIAAGMLAVFFTFFRVFVNAYGWFWPNYISFATFPLVMYISKFVFGREEVPTTKSNIKGIAAAFLSVTIIRIADIALNIGISQGYSAIVAPLAGAAPTLFITLSSLIYKDPVTKQQKWGIGVCLLGIVLLSFFN